MTYYDLIERLKTDPAAAIACAIFLASFVFRLWRIDRCDL